MTDQEYREIQLSGKQIVFLFMSLVVVAVVIFLLGVSVGRGVRSPGAETAQGAAPTGTIATVATPPPTQTAPGDLKYHSMLQGGSGQAGSSTATPPADPPPSSNPPPQTDPVPTEPPPPASPPPPTSGRAAGAAEPPAGAPARGTTPPSATPAAPPPKTGGWMVQVGAFRSRENAESLVAQLKKKGYPATIVRSSAAPTAPHHVRVGPYADRPEAERAAAVLAKEQGVSKPSVTR
jgi:DedD protein